MVLNHHTDLKPRTSRVCRPRVLDPSVRRLPDPAEVQRLLNWLVVLGRASAPVLLVAPRALKVCRPVWPLNLMSRLGALTGIS